MVRRGQPSFSTSLHMHSHRLIRGKASLLFAEDHELEVMKLVRSQRSEFEHVDPWALKFVWCFSLSSSLPFRALKALAPFPRQENKKEHELFSVLAIWRKRFWLELGLGAAAASRRSRNLRGNLGTVALQLLLIVVRPHQTEPHVA